MLFKAGNTDYYSSHRLGSPLSRVCVRASQDNRDVPAYLQASSSYPDLDYVSTISLIDLRFEPILDPRTVCDVTPTRKGRGQQGPGLLGQGRICQFAPHTIVRNTQPESCARPHQSP